ncbi:MAG: LPXTG cell wall anchor domain-containing protein [Oscillospiraceae bacterium]|nr:LPXTG cell wall anchor domain-containing protein [Oscillospiraceae bacterium]
MDKFIEDILDKAITSGMTDNQKIKAIYDYMIYNFEHDADSMPMFFGDFDGNANPLYDTITLAMPIIMTGSGTCDVFANVFRLLAIRLGYECNYVSGYYVNSNGEELGHGWNQILVDGQWYWLDVDVEGTVFRKGNYTEPLYFLFMKNDSEWISNHSWERDDWPAANGGAINVPGGTTVPGGTNTPTTAPGGTNATTAAKGDSLPKTGDNQSTGWIAVILFVAAAVGVVSLRIKKQYN